MIVFRGFRNALRSYVPIWLQNRPGFQVGYSILYAIALLCDIGLEYIFEGVSSWFPGYSLTWSGQALDASTALPLIGLSRGILRGEADTDASYAARLIRWIEDWEAAGSSQRMNAEIQAYLGNTPTVSSVDRSGNWVVVHPDGSVSKFTAATSAWAWNWDSLSNPERVGFWSDMWIIITPCEWPVTAGTVGGGGLAAIWGRTDVGIGHATNRIAVDAILATVASWKGDHTWIAAIVWNYNSHLFDPQNAFAGNPDGTWGEWGYASVPNGAILPTRNASARYWQPTNG